MSGTVIGVVKNGVVVPNSPLPEGAVVEIEVSETQPELTPELQEELAAWQLASAESLELVERLAEEMQKNEER